MRTALCSQACGQCEGYGGIPYGDANDEITLSSCTPVADNPNRTKIRPVWSTRMTMSPYYSVQIGPKKDPFCFQAIPENQSNGALCYQRQTGSQVYEMGKYNSLRFDVNLATGAGNVTSAVIAQGPYLWIVNHLPWYALGIKQCICTQPKQGGDATASNVYPLQYNWTNRMSWWGLENIFVEYVYKNMTLDHWNYGPHHVWTVPETGSIIRMWQPFNGLQARPLPPPRPPARRPPPRSSSGEQVYGGGRPAPVWLCPPPPQKKTRSFSRQGVRNLGRTHVCYFITMCVFAHTLS